MHHRAYIRRTHYLLAEVFAPELGRAVNLWWKNMVLRGQRVWHVNSFPKQMVARFASADQTRQFNRRYYPTVAKVTYSLAYL